MSSLIPCTLVGEHVELVPLRAEHAESLLQAGRGVDWAWMGMALNTLEDVERWTALAKAAELRGEEFVFVVKLKSDQVLSPEQNVRIIGSSRYMAIELQHKGVEIGGTWYSPSFQGTVVNPECKYLLLRHAFEDWGAIRVQLKTDVNNVHSQRAIVKLGARFEGRLRNHRIRRDGTFRDTMMYSITKDEWPEVKARLEARIESSGGTLG